MVHSQIAHKPGPLKQQNKSHKHGRHRSKGELDRLNRGKVNVKVLTKRNKNSWGKQERKNKLNQIRALKREKVLEKKRGLGSHNSAPILIGVLPLSDDVDPLVFIDDLTKCDESVMVEEHASQGIYHVKVPRYKSNITFVVLKKIELWHILDIAKAVDGFIFLHSITENTCFKNIFSTILSQGLPSSLHIVKLTENLSIKLKTEIKSRVKKIVSEYFTDDKVIMVEKLQDHLNVLRQVGEQKRKDIYFRDIRPYMMAETFKFSNDEEVAVGTLEVTGYLRGQNLSANQLVHIPGWGDYQIKKITQSPMPYVFCHRSESMIDDDSEAVVLSVPDPACQEPLDAENRVDEMEEQTWPTEEELEAAEKSRLEAMMKKKSTKRVPEGTSGYQAEWILEDDSGSDDLEDSEAEMNEDHSETRMSEEQSESENEQDFADMETTTEVDVNDEQYDKHVSFNMDLEMEQLNKIKEAREDQMFPDEIDTPLDIPARIRFQKYRGMKSFRSSPWDCKENLPPDYARIFQFQNMQRSKKRVLAEERDGAMVGWRITIHIQGVQSHLVQEWGQQNPIVLFGLLPYEQKMSVCNFVLKRFPRSIHPIKSKEKLMFQVGYRRYCACPIFSQHTGGSKHKFEKFFRAEDTVVASVFAPLMFPPTGVIVLQQDTEGLTHIVATGSLLSINPDRMIIKRVTLSGHPLKIHKKSAVIRYMFFNRDDITWFKPIELRTKYGRKGHIKEPLGTHGHMKCIFDGHLNSNDTVLMHLYKRVYPKWTFDPYVPLINSLTV